jgi:16S rRNA G966 N2-methylase RsmD
MQSKVEEDALTLQSNHHDEIESKLLQIISQEVQRDGGASVVRDLKDYNVQIKSLLRRCNQTKKLLTFLEMHPSIFEVDRNALPHVVYLITYNDCGTNSSASLESRECIEQQSIQEHLEDNRDSIKEQARVEAEFEKRIICTLKSERSRKDRRHNRQQNNDNNNNNNNDYDCNCHGKHSSSFGGVSLRWLLKQSKSQLHHYLRLCGFYENVYSNCKDVKIVGSPDWLNLVESKFIEILSTCHFCELQNDNTRINLSVKANNDNIDVQTIAMKLKEKVEEDGGTHISLSLLLNRYPELCTLLSGCDILSLKNKHEHLFQGINIYLKFNEVFLQSKVTKQGRMEVDETGLFSVASSKWGKTFASLMSYHCHNTLCHEPRETIAIDLTASVGGFTLPLSKAFLRVIAVEIDDHRAMLCRKNMENQGVSEKVDVLNQDSVETIPMIATELVKDEPKIVIVDPPWGGNYYKHEKKEITMGKWTMTEVIKQISDFLSPTITGIRMPVTFEVEKFYEALRDANVTFTSLQVKKAGPQLFIILSL